MWSKKLPIAEYSVVKKLDHRGFAATAGKPFSDSPNLVETVRFTSRSAVGAKAGGEYRDRTGDLLVANQALSQLS